MSKARATVQITVAIETASWGDDCSVGQVYKQAADDALQKLETALLVLRNKHSIQISIVGQPKVTAVITETP